MNHRTGMYEVVNTDGVLIRREPRIVDNSKVTNRVGKLKFGDQRRIYGLSTDKLNVTWGRVSEADGAGVAQWVCVEGLNRTYLKCIEPDPDPVDTLHARIDELTERMQTLANEIEKRLSALEARSNKSRRS